MTNDQITVNVEDLRVALGPGSSRSYDAVTSLRAALAEHDKAHPPVPDWQTDKTVVFIENTSGVVLRRDGDKWLDDSTGALWTWQEVVNGEPITPVGWRRDPDSITIPKSVLNDQPVGWWRNQAAGTFYSKVLRQVFDAIADALEAGQ